MQNLNQWIVVHSLKNRRLMSKGVALPHGRRSRGMRGQDPPLQWVGETHHTSLPHLEETPKKVTKFVGGNIFWSLFWQISSKLLFFIRPVQKCPAPVKQDCLLLCSTKLRGPIPSCGVNYNKIDDVINLLNVKTINKLGWGHRSTLR